MGASIGAFRLCTTEPMGQEHADSGLVAALRVRGAATEVTVRACALLSMSIAGSRWASSLDSHGRRRSPLAGCSIADSTLSIDSTYDFLPQVAWKS